jgi:hypothetical protein
MSHARSRSREWSRGNDYQVASRQAIAQWRQQVRVIASVTAVTIVSSGWNGGGGRSRKKLGLGVNCRHIARFAMPMRCALLCLAALAAGCLAGCGKPAKSAAEMDASELLALFQERQHVDAKRFVEVDLGRFRVAHKLSSGEGQLYVQFHLFGILPQERQPRLALVWPQFEKRARDAVISVVQRTETEHLSDPSLSLFKEEVVETINRVLQERLIVDAAFSDFSSDREPGMPWSLPEAEAKESRGRGGH